MSGFMRLQVWWASKAHPEVYDEGTDNEQVCTSGWFARYSAPGNMDCTDTVGPFGSADEAACECHEYFGDSGEDEASDDDLELAYFLNEVVEIAKLVRADIKKAIGASVDMPKGMKVSVRISRYAGGKSLSLSIEEFPGAVLNRARVFADALLVREDAVRMLYTLRVRVALATLERIAAAYQRDASDMQSDYFNCNFYLHVEVRTDTVTERAALLESDELADLRVSKAGDMLRCREQLEAYDTSGWCPGEAL